MGLAHQTSVLAGVLDATCNMNKSTTAMQKVQALESATLTSFPLTRNTID